VSVSEQKILNFRVSGQAPVEAVPALYSNFLAVSHVGTDVQFEFIFLDLNLVAGTLKQLKEVENPSVPELQGKTVSKLVMPAANFIQLREHFENLFKTLEGIVPKTAEAKNDRASNIR